MRQRRNSALMRSLIESSWLAWSRVGMAWTSIFWGPYALPGIPGTWGDSAYPPSTPRAAWLKVAFKENEPRAFLPAWRLTLCCRWSIGARLHSVSFWELPDTQLAGRLHEAAPRSCLMHWPRIYEVSAVKSFRIGWCGPSANFLLLGGVFVT